MGFPRGWVQYYAKSLLGKWVQYWTVMKKQKENSLLKANLFEFLLVCIVNNPSLLIWSWRKNFNDCLFVSTCQRPQYFTSRRALKCYLSLGRQLQTCCHAYIISTTEELVYASIPGRISIDRPILYLGLVVCSKMWLTDARWLVENTRLKKLKYWLQYKNSQNTLKQKAYNNS